MQEASLHATPMLDRHWNERSQEPMVARHHLYCKALALSVMSRTIRTGEVCHQKVSTRRGGLAANDEVRAGTGSVDTLAGSAWRRS